MRYCPILAMMVCLSGSPAWAGPYVPADGRPMPIEVGTERPISIPLPNSDSGKKYLLVVGSMERSGDPTPVTVSRQPIATGEPREPQVADESIPDWWLRQVERDHSLMLRQRDQVAEPEGYISARFAPRRVFHLFVGENNLYDTRKYAAVRARLAHVGAHCLIYADEGCPVEPALIEDVARTFDERVVGPTQRVFGQHRDVDRNGKFTILLTDWLDRLSDGKVSLSGFVRGADFYRDVEAPYSNQCDMMYLNANLAPDEHMRTVLAHEYTHAITFSEHTFGEYLPGGQGRDEENWLGEAIAHVAENLAGEGWSNLDYRISTYLSDPSAYRLVVPDYFQDGLWRCHGCRGATYLFLRYLVDRFGESLLTDLSRSNLSGVANIEVATQTPFRQLFRDWSVALALGGVMGHAIDDGLTSIPLYGRVGERILAGARPRILEEVPIECTVAPTGWASIVVEAESGMEVVVDAPRMADLQITLIPLPNAVSFPRLHLAAHPNGGPGIVMELSSERNVRWQTISWERASLRQHHPRANEKQAYIVPAREMLSRRPADSPEWVSGAIRLDEYVPDPVVVKAVGIDDHGRFVTAWSVWDPAESSPLESASPIIKVSAESIIPPGE